MKRTRKRGELSLFRRATVALAVVLGLVFGAGAAWATRQKHTRRVRVE